MKLVGDAVRSSGLHLPLIGIAPWGIFGSEIEETLLSSFDDNDLYCDKHTSDGVAKLNPYHNHFVLVDSGKSGRDAFGSEIALRAAFEGSIYKTRRHPV